MSVFPKFIIETDDQLGDCIIIGKCNYHKQLATNTEKVKGGGWWILDQEKSIFTLHGESQDFGRARIEDIVNCVQNKKVFSNRALITNLTDDYKFQYRNQYGEIFDLDTYSNTIK